MSIPGGLADVQGQGTTINHRAQPMANRRRNKDPHQRKRPNGVKLPPSVFWRGVKKYAYKSACTIFWALLPWFLEFLRVVFRVVILLWRKGWLETTAVGIYIIYIWFDPSRFLALLKWLIVGAICHIVFSMLNLAWFDESGGDVVPVFKLLGFEFTMRNSREGCKSKQNRPARGVPLQNEPSSIPTTHGTKRTHRYSVCASGLFVAPSYTANTVSSGRYLELPSYTFIPKAGLLFLLNGLNNATSAALERRRLILQIQIMHAFLDQIDGLIRHLTALLANLTPPTGGLQTAIQLRIANQELLRTLAKQISKSLYTRTDHRQLGHAWWHDREYPSTLSAKDVQELITWIKLCLHKLIMKKRPKLQSDLARLNKALIEILFKDGISRNPPRGRRARAEDAARAQQVEKKVDHVESSAQAEQVLDDMAVYSGVAGDLAGLPRAGVITVDEDLLREDNVIATYELFELDGQDGM